MLGTFKPGRLADTFDLRFTVHPDDRKLEGNSTSLLSLSLFLWTNLKGDILT